MCSLATESVGLEAGLENECKPLTINDSALKDTGNDPKAIPLIPERSASPIITITPPDSERRVRLTITSEHTWIASQALNPLGGPHHNSKAGLRPLSSSNSCPDTRRMSFPAPVRVLSRKSSLCFSVKSASGPGELTERLIVTRDSRDGFLTPEYRRREPSRRASTSLCSTPTPSSSRFAGSSSQSSPLTDFALTVQSPVHRPTRAGDSTRPLDRLFNRRYSTDGSLSLLNLSCAEKRAISTGLEKDDVIAEQRRKGYRRTSSASEANIRNDETGESSSTETVIRPKRWAWDVMHPEERVCATHDQDEVLSSVEIEAMEVLVPVREPSGFYFREVGETIRAAGPVPSVVVGLGGATEGHYERNIEGRFNKEHRRKLKSRSSVVYRFFTSVPQQDGNSSTDTLSSVGQRTPFRVLTHKISTNVLRFIGGSTSPLLHQSTESSLWNIPDETEENVRKQKKAYRSSEGNKANPNDPNGKKPFWHYPLDKHIERAQQTKKKSRKIHGTSVILYFRKLTKGIFTKNAKQETVPEPGVAEVDGATPPTEDIIGEMLGEPEFGEPRLGEGSMHLEGKISFPSQDEISINTSIRKLPQSYPAEKIVFSNMVRTGRYSLKWFSRAIDECQLDK